MATVSYAIVGHHSRRDAAHKLSARLSASVAMDEGHTGSLANHDFAWSLGYSSESDWTIVIEDDAILIEGFESHALDALGHVPTVGCVSFYTGTGKPRPMIRQVVAKAVSRGNSWLKANTLFWGPAVALPSRLVPRMLQEVKESSLPYDQRIGWWLRKNELPCFYSIPSLVDHSDGPSLIKGSSKARKACDFREPQSWNKRFTILT